MDRFAIDHGDSHYHSGKYDAPRPKCWCELCSPERHNDSNGNKYIYGNTHIRRDHLDAEVVLPRILIEDRHTGIARDYGKPRGVQVGGFSGDKYEDEILHATSRFPSPRQDYCGDLEEVRHGVSRSAGHHHQPTARRDEEGRPVIIDVHHPDDPLYWLHHDALDEDDREHRGTRDHGGDHGRHPNYRLSERELVDPYFDSRRGTHETGPERRAPHKGSGSRISHRERCPCGDVINKGRTEHCRTCSSIPRVAEIKINNAELLKNAAHANVAHINGSIPLIDNILRCACGKSIPEFGEWECRDCNLITYGGYREGHNRSASRPYILSYVLDGEIYVFGRNITQEGYSPCDTCFWTEFRQVQALLTPTVILQKRPLDYSDGDRVSAEIDKLETEINIGKARLANFENQRTTALLVAERIRELREAELRVDERLTRLNEREVGPQIESHRHAKEADKLRRLNEIIVQGPRRRREGDSKSHHEHYEEPRSPLKPSSKNEAGKEVKKGKSAVKDAESAVKELLKQADEKRRSQTEGKEPIKETTQPHGDNLIVGSSLEGAKASASASRPSENPTGESSRIDGQTSSAKTAQGQEYGGKVLEHPLAADEKSPTQASVSSDGLWEEVGNGQINASVESEAEN